MHKKPHTFNAQFALNEAKASLLRAIHEGVYAEYGGQILGQICFNIQGIERVLEIIEEEEKNG